MHVCDYKNITISCLVYDIRLCQCVWHTNDGMNVPINKLVAIICVVYTCHGAGRPQRLHYGIT